MKEEGHIGETIDERGIAKMMRRFTVLPTASNAWLVTKEGESLETRRLKTKAKG